MPFPTALHLDSSRVNSYEGDNFLLDLQVVRAALKAYKKYSSAGRPDPSTLPPTARYLRLLAEQSICHQEKHAVRVVPYPLQCSTMMAVTGSTTTATMLRRL